jgi:hypothetical protein
MLQAQVWDANKDGTVDKDEFFTSVRTLGCTELARHECDALFDSFDTDHSGKMEYATAPLAPLLTVCVLFPLSRRRLLLSKPVWTPFHPPT